MKITITILLISRVIQFSCFFFVNAVCKFCNSLNYSIIRWSLSLYDNAPDENGKCIFLVYYSKIDTRVYYFWVNDKYLTNFILPSNFWYIKISVVFCLFFIFFWKVTLTFCIYLMYISTGESKKKLCFISTYVFI